MMIVKSRHRSPWIVVAVTLMLLACVAIGVQWWTQANENSPNPTLSSADEAHYRAIPLFAQLTEWC